MKIRVFHFFFILTFICCTSYAITITSISHEGEIQTNTSSILFLIQTNQSDTCSYSTTEMIPFENKSLFNITNSTQHSTNLSGFSNGNAYNFYIQCENQVIAEEVEVTITILSEFKPNSCLNNNRCFKDMDGEWMINALSNNFSIRAQHPRFTLPSKDQVSVVLDRAYGINAQEPYSTWFNRVKELEDEGTNVTFANLALLFLATKDEIYLNKFINRSEAETGLPEESELYGIDLIYEYLPYDTLLKVYKRGTENEFSYQLFQVSNGISSPRWGYHVFYKKAVMFASLFAFTEVSQNPEIIENLDIYRFNITKFLDITYNTLTPGGDLWTKERGVSGDMSLIDGIQGDYGGVYDNFGYDQAEESDSIFVLATMSYLTKENLHDDFLRDKYKGRFYQMMYLPYTQPFAREVTPTSRYCYAKDHISFELVDLWYEHVGKINQPNMATTALRANLYNDPRMQFFADHGRDIFSCGDNIIKNLMYFDILFYNSSIPVEYPDTNPTSMYFSGPGLISSRTSWNSPDSVFSLFMSGDPVSRKYADGNSFLLSRKSSLIIHSGGRYRPADRVHKSFWFSQRSASANTLKIFDPNECFDQDPQNFGYARSLCAGNNPLYDYQNLGGQMLKTGIVGVDMEYSTSSSPVQIVKSLYPPRRDLGEMKKFEFVEGKYSYGMGDSTRAYTQKIDLFEREHVFLYPDIVVTFDRVNSANPNFKKFYTLNVNPPIKYVEGDEYTSNFGYQGYKNTTKIIVGNKVDEMTVHPLYPEQTNVHIRGGYHNHFNGSLSRGETKNLDITLDIPRWVELSVVGDDMDGSIIITGDTLDQNDVSDTITFNNELKIFERISDVPLESTQNSIQVSENPEWIENQWIGYSVKTYGTSNYETITGNSEDTLFVDNFDNAGNPWRLEIVKELGNSVEEFTNIKSITTSDMDIDYLDIKTLHRLDALSASGKVYKHAPYTTQRDSEDPRNPKEVEGSFTIDIEALDAKRYDNFLNVISVNDPGQYSKSIHLLNSTDVLGSLINNQVVLFSRLNSTLSNYEITIPYTGVLELLLFNLEPSTTYYVNVINSTLSVSNENNGGTSHSTSTMGVLVLDKSLQNPLEILPEILSSSFFRKNNVLGFDFDFDFLVNYSIDINGETQSSSSFLDKHRFTINNLQSSTNYPYTLTFCNLQNSCSSFSSNISTNNRNSFIRFNSTYLNNISLDLNSLNITELRNLRNLRISRNTSSIFFPSLDINRDISLESNLILEENKIFINSSNLPFFNVSAELIFYNLSFENPEILRDGVLCSSCTKISYINSTLIFNVSGFSEYTTREKQESNSEDTSSGGSSNGGGSSRGSNLFIPTSNIESNTVPTSYVPNLICTPDFYFSSWSSCNLGEQSRKRTDLNSCSSSEIIETRFCSSEDNSLEKVIELNSLDINLSLVGERYYTSNSFNSSLYLVEFIRSPVYEELSFILYDEVNDIQYYALLIDTIDSQNYYSLKEIDVNLEETLKSEGLYELSIGEKVSTTLDNVKSSKSYKSLLITVGIFLVITLIVYSYFLATRYSNSKHHVHSMYHNIGKGLSVSSSDVRYTSYVLSLRNYIQKHNSEHNLRKKLEHAGWSKDILDEELGAKK